MSTSCSDDPASAIVGQLVSLHHNWISSTASFVSSRLKMLKMLMINADQLPVICKEFTRDWSNAIACKTEYKKNLFGTCLQVFFYFIVCKDHFCFGMFLENILNDIQVACKEWMMNGVFWGRKLQNPILIVHGQVSSVQNSFMIPATRFTLLPGDNHTNSNLQFQLV